MRYSKDKTMKNTLLVSFFFTFSFVLAKSQSQPNAFVEDYNIHAVIVKEDATYYAISTDIVKVDDNNVKTIVDNRSTFNACLEGKFYDQPEGWTYLGWRYLNDDAIFPRLILSQYQNGTVNRKEIDFLNQSNNLGSFISATYQSNDSIFILVEKWNDYKIVIVNSAADILESSQLDLHYLKEMILIDKDINLIIGDSNLYIWKGNNIENHTSFEDKIIDVKYYHNKRIEVLTEDNIYWLNTSLELQKTIPLPINSRTTKAFYTANDLTYLIEIENNQSYISSIDTLGNNSDVFVESPDIVYEDLKIYNDRFNIWGVTDCFLSGSIIKMDLDGLDFEIPTIDIAIDELITIDISDMTDTIFPIERNFSWQITVTNYGSEAIGRYTVNSNSKNEGNDPYISFSNQDPLLPSESRIHEGEFSYIESSASIPPDVTTWIGADKLDENCTNNVLHTSLVTSTIDKPQQDIRLYPNPTTNEIWIEHANDFSYKIYNMTGAILHSAENYHEKYINVEFLPSGFYIIEIQTYNHKVFETFFKN